jgi:hypothetical protein
MVVLHAISAGRSLARACAIALSTASGSWPSTLSVCQPQASNRFT